MNRSTVEEIKARLPIEDVIGAYIKIEKSGKTLKAKCPFHNEKTASFFISPERQGYYCFGCNAKGDIFTFVQQFEGLDFRGALKILAERAGVPLVYDERSDGDRDKMYKIMEDATLYFETELQKNRDALEYVKSRGISKDTIVHFRIGWAPDAWSRLRDHLQTKKWSTQIMEKVGLIKKGDNDTRYYDRFRGRIMFPISDSSGRVVAFSGRILKDDGKSAKYLNSPDSPLYDKSQVLYGLDKAKNEIRRMGYAVFVEGQMDLVMSHQAGIRNVVAASGTALTEDAFNKDGMVSNLGLVRRLSPNIIIAFDSDSAGQKAALRASNIALSLGMDVKMAMISGGKDPADLVRDDPEKWKNTLRSAVHVVDFELTNVMSLGLDQRKLGKAVFDRVLPLVARLERASDQSDHVQRISEVTGISMDAIWQDVKVVRSKLVENNSSATRAAKSYIDASSQKQTKLDIIERQIFGMLFVMGQRRSTDDYEKVVKEIIGQDYSEKLGRAESMKSDLMFEAEEYFGNDEKNWDKHLKELLSGYESDLVNENLFKAMVDLRRAEKNGDNEQIAILAKKCQELSTQKAKLNRR